MADFRPQTQVSATIEGVSLISFQSTATVDNVPATTLTTILSQTYSATFNNVALLSVSGDDYAKYTLFINTVLVDTRRSGPTSNLEFDYRANPLALSPGDVVDIKVEHFQTGQLLSFNATIYGYA